MAVGMVAFSPGVGRGFYPFLPGLPHQNQKRRTIMGMFEDAEVAYIYGLAEVIDDGVLVPVFQNRWKEISGGKPIVATSNLFDAVSLGGLMEIWNEFVLWRKNIMPTLPEEEQMFQGTMNGRKVWVIEDDAAFTLMYPEDY
jgi:hypothetical protein